VFWAKAKLIQSTALAIAVGSFACFIVDISCCDPPVESYSGPFGTGHAPPARGHLVLDCVIEITLQEPDTFEPKTQMIRLPQQKMYLRILCGILSVVAFFWDCAPFWRGIIRTTIGSAVSFSHPSLSLLGA